MLICIYLNFIIMSTYYKTHTHTHERERKRNSHTHQPNCNGFVILWIIDLTIICVIRNVVSNTYFSYVCFSTSLFSFIFILRYVHFSCMFHVIFFPSLSLSDSIPVCCCCVQIHLIWYCFCQHAIVSSNCTSYIFVERARSMYERIKCNRTQLQLKLISQSDLHW